MISVGEAKRDVNQYLDVLASERIAEADKESQSYGVLWREIARIIKAGGKRVRPYMVLLAYEIFGGKDKQLILPAAAASELLHIAMLAHDDIIDRDDIRHGQETIHASYINGRYKYLGDTDKKHFSQSAALLAGDALISESYYQLSLVRSSNQADLMKTMHRAIRVVVGGELLDTECSFLPQVATDTPIDKIAEQKTASYTFEAPLVMGALLAGASRDDIATLRQFSHVLGIGFQIRDDVLGVFGQEDETGKSSLGDIREGKLTHLVKHFYELANEEQQTVFNAAYGKEDATIEMIRKAKKVLDESGALAMTERMVDDYAAKADSYIKSLGISREGAAALGELKSMALKRRA